MKALCQYCKALVSVRKLRCANCPCCGKYDTLKRIPIAAVKLIEAQLSEEAARRQLVISRLTSV